MCAYVSMNKVYRMVIVARRCMYMPKAVCMSKGYVLFIFVMRIIRILTVIPAMLCMHVLVCVCTSQVWMAAR
jgi:hypothetical protein